MHPLALVGQNLPHLLSKSIQDNIVFLHLPKCAGTSLDSAIRSRFPIVGPGKHPVTVRIDSIASLSVVERLHQSDSPFNKSDDVLKLRETLLLYFMNLKNVKFISGHFCFSEKAYHDYSDKYKFITVLRDPVKRWISAYFYNTYKEDNSWRINEQDISRYLASPRAEAQGHEYIKKFFGKIDKNIDYTSLDSINRAKLNLNKFTVVGILERLEVFQQHFKYHFGVKLRLPRKNVNPKSDSFKKSIITLEIEDQIRSICRPDIELYSYACDTFLSKCN